MESGHTTAPGVKMRVFVTDGNTPAGTYLINELTLKGHDLCFPQESESLDSTEEAEKILARVTHSEPVDGVVMTEDIFIPHTLSEGTEKDFDRVFDSLATRVFFTVKVFGKYLMAQKKAALFFCLLFTPISPTESVVPTLLPWAPWRC
jgi:NAD(P)-dependent dehydrogenase (short-subunit alcohol dehydrogenase family)